MPIVTGFDLETTGFLKPDQKIIEANFRIFDYETRTQLKNITFRMNPERSITPGAFKVHGIHLDDLKGEPLFKDVAPKILKILQITDCLVAHNGDGFDFPFLYQEFDQANIQIEDIPDTYPFDTMVEGRWATLNGKFPSLEELCFSVDVDYQQADAHAADYDTDVMMKSVWKGVDLGRFVLPV